MRFGSLFSGIGGLDLGLERAGMTCAWQVEISGFCRRVLAKHWPDVPKFGDIRELTGDELEPVPFLAGGFPCQDLSSAHTAGVRLGLAGQQSGLWAEFRRLLGVLRPRYVLIENVAMWPAWVPDVRADLSRLGYASVPLALQAGSLGAPHKRPRVFVVANANGQSESLRAIYEEVASLSPFPREIWKSLPDAVGMDDGLPHRVERLRGLGNAVVPQVAEWIGRRIMEVAA